MVRRATPAVLRDPLSGPSAPLMAEAPTHTTPLPEQLPPTVSVVVATRDRPVLLARAVQAILDQRYAGRVECIVVFDQSQPGPINVTVPNDRRLRTMSNDRTPGLAGARNTGLLAATGALVGFCDDDDEWMADKLGRQVDVLLDNPSAPAVGCGVVLVENGRESAKPATLEQVTFSDLLRGRVWELNPCTVLARLDIVREQVGLVDEELPGSYGEDYDWLLRTSKLAAIPMIDEPLVRINWHPGSFFQRRWTTISAALTYLLDKHPEFSTEPAGLARIQGQIAFAQAASGQRAAARRTAWSCLRNNWRERRAYLALAVSWHLLTPSSVVRAAHARGKGI